MKVPFYLHGLTEADAENVAGVLRTPFLTSATVCRQVEEQLASYFDVPHAVLTNSWTNGMVATLLALGIGFGDEVIVPATTFVATANAARLVGATPVFVDVDPSTLMMTVHGVAEAITPHTRAIIPVHLYGQMADVRALSDLCKAQAQKVWLLEDAAHCFEGTLDGYRPGTHSDAALFSFYATKNVTCGEGGAIITRHDALHRDVRQTSTHGLSKGAIDRFRKGHYQHWDMEVLGMKANLPDLLAALLPSQISGVDALLPERARLAGRYRAAFANGPLRLVQPIANCVSAEHLFAVGIPNGHRDAAMKALNDAGIGCTVNYRSVTSMAYYKKLYPQADSMVPVAAQWGEETLSLPLYPGLTERQQDHVIDLVTRDIYSMCAG